jgi:hypothetical protein
MCVSWEAGVKEGEATGNQSKCDLIASHRSGLMNGGRKSEQLVASQGGGIDLLPQQGVIYFSVERYPGMVEVNNECCNMRMSRMCQHLCKNAVFIRGKLRNIGAQHTYYKSRHCLSCCCPRTCTCRQKGWPGVRAVRTVESPTCERALPLLMRHAQPYLLLSLRQRSIRPG